MIKQTTTKEVIFCTNFWIRQVVKLEIKKIKRPIIWNGWSTLNLTYRFTYLPEYIFVEKTVNEWKRQWRHILYGSSNFDTKVNKICRPFLSRSHKTPQTRQINKRKFHKSVCIQVSISLCIRYRKKERLFTETRENMERL